MTLAKKGQPVPQQAACDTSIEAQVNLGRQLGARGAPAIFLSDGR